MKKTVLTALVTALLVPLPAFAGTAGGYLYRGYTPGIVASGPPAAAPSQTFNFSTCGQTGRTGPTLAQCKTAYASQSGITASLAMPGYQGYQEWTVPTTGNYTITAAGAGGGTTAYSQSVGGGGAIMRATVLLVQGDVLQILVGQAGIDAQLVGAAGQTDAGGGGGTFVIKKAGTQPLVVAGGGGGANYYSNGSYYGSGGNGTTATTGGTSPVGKSEGSAYLGGSAGTGGNGSTTGWGEPGAGFLSNGGYPAWGTTGFTVAEGFQIGAVGGVSTNSGTTANRYGGFGGGAGAHGLYCVGGGAGGGYSGGAGAAGCTGGGGGGSYLVPGATNMATSDGNYNGAAVGPALGYGSPSSPGYVSVRLN
jgi:hypothetical protein